MHFFYLDETGCGGADLNPDQEPVFVLGGISVRDEAWVVTTEAVEKVFRDYFAPNDLPPNFELHAHQLLSPNGEGPFAGHARADRNKLATDLLDLLSSRKHEVHYIAIDKTKMAENATGEEHAVFNARVPYLLGFDYLSTYVNWLVKEKLGRSARGILILDEKEQFDEAVARIARFRRFEGPKTRRIKWLVEFSYSIDSQKHPMIQLTDLVIFCVRKFFEMDGGYRENWVPAAKTFYAECFSKIYDRVKHKSLVEQAGQHAAQVNALLANVRVAPRHNWKGHYGVA